MTIKPINAWMTSANGPSSWHESGSISVPSGGCQRGLGRSRGGRTLDQLDENGEDDCAGIDCCGCAVQPVEGALHHSVVQSRTRCG